MTVADEIVVVTEQQQQIACPENKIQLHESNYRDVPRYGKGLGGRVFPAKRSNPEYCYSLDCLGLRLYNDDFRKVAH
jgi:hypothetical protein